MLEREKKKKVSEDGNRQNLQVSASLFHTFLFLKKSDILQFPLFLTSASAPSMLAMTPYNWKLSPPPVTGEEL